MRFGHAVEPDGDKPTMTHRLHSIAAAAALAGTLLACASPAHAAGPAYSWSNVKLGGTGYVPGMIAHPGQQGLFYAKTDMGGAYRYQASTSTWIPLTDWVSAPMGNQLGIDSLAIDPNDTSRLYMVVGSYYWGDKGTFLSSSNQGASFQQVPLPFSTGANMGGRQVGERLQVDPNNGTVLFYGTGNYAANGSNNGLWTSTNRGATWTKVGGGFPTLSSDGTGAGVAFVAFHAGSAKTGQTTPTLFAAINTKSVAENGAVLYRSNDGGRSWSAVNGAPRGVMPQRGQVGPDGNLYITFAAPATYADYPGGPQVTHYDGPNGLTGGQVWKYNVSSSAWTHITPASNGSNTNLGYAFAGLSVDPWRPGWLIVNTLDRWYPNDTMYRTTDGGATWTDIGPNASFDVSASPWTGPVTSLGGWENSLLDPYDTNHAFVAWGGGIRETKNLTAARTNWAYGHNGIEETAVQALASPTANVYNAYPLISGGGDICGFTHASVSTPPSAAFKFQNCSVTSSIAYAGNDSRIVVRVGDSQNDPNGTHYGQISWNGGYSWSPFTSNGATTQGQGVVTINTDGSTILWSAPDVAPAYSNSATYAWTSLAGALPKGSLVAADGYNANLFYAYDPATGAFYFSGNKATGWAQAATLPSGARQIGVTPGVQGDVWAAVEWNGLYHNTSSGWGTWTRTAGVEIVRAFGFGKAAPGSSYPAIYLSGKVSGVDGFFRSTDAGATWVRINDDQHQWGGAYVITGDPKTFGTVYIGTNGRGIVQGTSAN